MPNKSLQPTRALAIEQLPTEKLHPSPTNPRKHSPAQVRKIADSIRSFGFSNPILIDDDNGVLAGHGRLSAAKLLGMSEAPTVRLSGMTPAERRAFVIADNRIAELSGFDKGLLAIELEYLLDADLGFDVETLGFDSGEIDRLLCNDDALGGGEEVALPDPDAVPVSRIGDLWMVGENRVLVGDAREREGYERLLDGAMAQMVFTDSPYNVPIAGNVSGLGAKVHDDFAMACGEMSKDEFTYQFLRPVLRHIAAFSQPGAIVYACMDWRHIRELQDAADGVFFEQKNLICWVKSNAGMGAFYRSQHELVLVFKASPGQHINTFGLGGKGRHRSNVWQYPGVNTFRRGRMTDLVSHPTVKPKRMVADAILDCSKPRGIILDPFLGSGTTAVAAAATGRIGYGIEFDPRYADLCLRRLEDETGIGARLITGEPFAEVAIARDVKPVS